MQLATRLPVYNLLDQTMLGMCIASLPCQKESFFTYVCARRMLFGLGASMSGDVFRQRELSLHAVAIMHEMHVSKTLKSV